LRRLQVEAILTSPGRGQPMGDSTWRHLAARLVDVLASRPLTRTEGAEVRQWLRPPEIDLFFDQSKADQRHGLNCAQFVAVSTPERDDLIRAALLHDVGKRHAHLGPIGRTAVTTWAKLGGQTSGRAAIYLNHGEAGGEDLEATGAGRLVADFARHHHEHRPESIPQEDWDVLQAADRAPNQVVRRKT